ncbi:MAG: DUF922 domain-containing protein [Rhizobiaceae bacterium]
MKSRGALTILVAICLAMAAGIAEARVIIKESTKYYTVSGRNGEQIYNQLRRKGPRIGGSKGHYVATATISFAIRNIDAYGWRDQCVIRNMDVVLTVVYRIPKWNRPKGASRELTRAWEDFLSHVWRHEKQHVGIAKDTAYELWRALKGVKGTRSKQCKDMLKPAERRAKAIYKRHGQKQDRFDASSFGDGGRQFRYDRRLVQVK